mmetsp:Transcript_113833/g.321951  ORF Transcript_113833/g.321951 Transcript_113833/m.321951 type:complete len:192 (-) Transcript_113833:79-654(-)|eukprot:CAMPEP_0117481576 /NCGR_PEP_ID=MMETSP0784-20121206/12970_1 /TAXON_ID=39447 /ORGANISM="" /LENGTH=191 /DNA_ID=CAMNT_0005276035 /DNA_START=80 /DNA_END=655 /DNA_ORIENTATION=-
MARRPDIDFEVRWLPYQLNPSCAEKPSSKIEMYMRKFGKSKAEVQQIGSWMANNFEAVGLPYKFTEAGLVSNTFQAHRLLTVAYKLGGPVAQDKVAESLFHSYFADELAPNNPVALQAAAEAAGLDGKAILSDSSVGLDETRDELEIGRRYVREGVPHFVISAEGSAGPAQVSGAQPVEYFEKAFAQVTRR